MEPAGWHIERWGDAGPRVVLVHGGVQGSAAGGARSFAGQRGVAERGFRLVVPDRPGHGRSADPGRPDDAEADGTGAAELLEDGAHLVGHSFGGCVALAACARRPEAVHSLTLIEPAMHALAASDPRVRPFLLRMLRTMFFSLSPARRGRRAMQLLGIPAEITGNTSDEELAKMGRNLRRSRLPAKGVLEDQLAQLERVGIPLLVVTGGWSPAFEASSDRVAELGGGRRVVVPSGHHFPQLVADQFNRVLAAFLRESEAGRQSG